jgi:hypothetical protein
MPAGADFRRTKNSSTQSDDIKLQTVSLKIVSKMKRIIVLLALIDLVGLSLK